MSKQLPKRPNLDHLRRQAKSLLSDLRRGDAEAARTFIKHLPEAAKLTQARVRSAGFRLADAQSAIARKTGFASWPSLSRHVQALRMLEGDWRFESLEIDGQSVPKSALTASRILIDGDCFRTESPEGNYEGLFTIDVEAEPTRIDIEFIEGPEAGNWCYGLFQVDGDGVTFCLGLVGSSRPKAFETAPGRGHALERLRREHAGPPLNVSGGTRPSVKGIQPDAEPPRVDSASFDAPLSPMLTRLQGEWTPLELVQEGAKMKDEWLAYGSRRTEGNETRVVFGGQTMLQAKMRVDETTTPVSVDYLNLTGKARGQISLGIIEWNGDEVTFHVAPAGKPRPADFINTKEQGGTQSRWKRKA